MVPALGLLALASPTAAAPVWRDIETVPAEDHASAPAITFDATGNALVTWLHSLRRARVDGHRVVAVVTVRAAGLAPVTRRITLKH